MKITLLAVGGICILCGLGSAEPSGSGSSVDVIFGPALSAANPAEPGWTGAAQYTWQRRSAGRAPVILVVRYGNEEFKAPHRFSISWADRGAENVDRAHFFEGGAGVRSSSARGSALWFGDFEAGMAVIAYDENDRSRTDSSPYFGIRVGSEWPVEARVRLIVASGMRLYPAVNHLVGHLSAGFAGGM